MLGQKFLFQKFSVMVKCISLSAHACRKFSCNTHKLIQYNSIHKSFIDSKAYISMAKVNWIRYSIISINESFIQGGLLSAVYQSDIAVSLSLFICVKKSENLRTMIWSSLLIM